MSTFERRGRPNLVELESRLTPVQNFVVTTTAWDVGVEGSLPWAVQEANANAGKDLISFDFVALGNTPTFTSDETLTVAEEVSIVGAPNPTLGKSVTIKGEAPFVFTHLPVGGVVPGNPPPLPSGNSTINGLVFLECRSEEMGVIRVDGGDLLVTNTTFDKNVGERYGGAILVKVGASLTVGMNTSFVENSATWGGAIANYGQVTVNALSTFFLNKAIMQVGNVLTEDETGTDGRGGAIYSKGKLEIESGSPLFRENYAYRGGGAVYFEGSSTNSIDASVIAGGTFEHNTVGKNAGGIVTTGDGGGVQVAGGFLKISGATFFANKAGSGGGLSVASGAIAEIKSSTFEYNETPKVDGAYRGRAIDVKSGASVYVQSSTFNYNGIRGTYTNNPGNTFYESPDE